MGFRVVDPLPGWNVRGYSFLERTDDGQLHPGLDLKVGAGDEDAGRDVVAFMDGVVVARLAWDGVTYGYGNRLLVRHDLAEFALWSLSAHLAEFDGSALEGAGVSAGQRLGACGKSGFQPWAHLHFELRYRGPEQGMAADYWGGRLSVGEIVGRYADPGTVLRLAPLLEVAPGPAPDCSAIQRDRDYNYALKMAMEGDRRSREGRRTLIRPGSTDALIASVGR